MKNHHKTSNELLGFKLRALYPELARDLTNVQILSDCSLLPEIYNRYFRNYPENKSERIKGSYLFVAVILKLYDPDMLQGWKRNMIHGLRNPIAELLEVSPNAISNQIITVQNYMLIYQKFKDRVEVLSKEIAEIYSKKGLV